MTSLNVCQLFIIQQSMKLKQVRTCRQCAKIIDGGEFCNQECEMFFRFEDSSSQYNKALEKLNEALRVMCEERQHQLDKLKKRYVTLLHNL